MVGAVIRQKAQYKKARYLVYILYLHVTGYMSKAGRSQVFLFLDCDPTCPFDCCYLLDVKHGASKSKQKTDVADWLDLRLQNALSFFFPFSYISDLTKLIEYTFGTVGWYSNHQNKYSAGFGVLGVIFGDFQKILTIFF